MSREVSASVTVVTKFPNDGAASADTLLTKRITLGADGRPSADGSACRMARGSAISIPAPDADALARTIGTLTPSQALILGTLAAGAGIRRDVVTQRVLSKLSEATRLNTIARTREHIAYPVGKPGWLLIDNDPKGMPNAVAALIDATGGVWQGLLRAAPALARAERVSRASTSAGLSHGVTGEAFPGTGGEHHYILVKDSGDVDRALRDLRDRCWLHDMGWYLLGASGHLLLRSIVDATVGGGERLCFEGPPEVVPPLAQDTAGRAPSVFKGEAIDTRDVIPPLTPHERGLVRDQQTQARRELEPAAKAARAAVDNVLVAELRKNHPEAIARRIVTQRHDRRLLPDIVIDFDHHGLIKVGEVLADPAGFVGETLCDPFEGAGYGRDKAMVLRARDGTLIVHSFAHGGALYYLRHDLASALQALALAGKAEALTVMCELDASADLEADETQQLIAEAARISANGVRVVNKRLADARRARDLARRKERAEAEAARDAGHRLVRPAPPQDGRRTEVVEEIDEVLAAEGSDRPPMRDRTGALIEVRAQTLRSLHELTSQSANADPLPEEAEPLPAPPEPLLVHLTPIEVELLVEDYFNWFRVDSDDRRYDAALPRPFIDALMAWPRSTMPTVLALNTAPLVLANGEVLSGAGLDRANGLFHHVEPGLQACVPSGLVTRQAAQEAVKWLCGEWLCDVLTDDAGKLTTILYASTCLQRTLLPERPGFLITAGRRGGGKSTLCHMVHMAVFGRRAPAASWSPHEEERRKSLFSYLRAGVASIVWDNVVSGSVINSEVVNRALTSETLSDRILGLSKHAIVAATMIQAWTGNLIGPGGDFTRRARKIHLETDMPRPEDRAVRHQDPVGWTEQHRGEILRCLYTILIHAGQHRPKNQIPQTGMKTWWQQVGYCAEVAGPLLEPAVAFSCVAEDKKLDAVDTEAEAVVTVLRLVWNTFGTEVFTAADIARTIEKSNDCDVRLISGLSPEEIKKLATDKAAGAAFAEALKELAPQRKPSLTPNGISRLLTSSVVDQGHYLESALTISGSLKWWVEHNTKRFQLKVTGENPPEIHTPTPRPPANTAPNNPQNPPEGIQLPSDADGRGGGGFSGPVSAEGSLSKVYILPEVPEPPHYNQEESSLPSGKRAAAPSPTSALEIHTSVGEIAAHSPTNNPNAPLDLSDRDIRDTANAYPTWPPERIARHLGVDVARVTATLHRGE